MRATCTRNAEHDAFITTAHVVEEWRVARDGSFIELVETLEVSHGPNPDNYWECAICGSRAEVKR